MMKRNWTAIVICLVLLGPCPSSSRQREAGVTTEYTNLASTLNPPTTTPYLPPPPIEQTVRLHQEARMTCSLPSRRGTTTPTWRHGDQLVAPASAHRYSIDVATGELSISNVRLEDGGVWQCVEHDPTTDRMLAAARPILLVVLEPPREVYLEVDGRRLDPGNLFVPVAEGASLSVWCVCEGGHPPPSLSWQLRGRPLNTSMRHRGRSEALLPRVLRGHHNASVACIVRHETLAAPLNASLLLDVQYSPSFAITRIPGFGFPVTEGIPVSLKCDVDSNPPSNPIWQKDDGPPPVPQSADGFLNFSSIRREHSGWYKCTSREFSSIGYFLNVRAEEVVTQEAAEPSTGVEVSVELGGAVQLQCPGGGCWGRVGPDASLEPLGQGPELSMQRVLYQEAGHYRCVKAFRPDLDARRADLEVQLSVTGAPMVYPSRSNVSAEAGDNVVLTAELCANPPATRVLWLAHSLVIRPGEHHRHVGAHNLTGGSSPHCQVASLWVRASARSAGEFSLLARSPGGLAEASFILAVAAGPPRPAPLPALFLLPPFALLYWHK